MTRVHFATALMVRNEKDRFLPEVLDWAAQWGPLIILDDHSTDGTFEYCRDHRSALSVERVHGGPDGAWGTEAPARQQLWELASEYATWVLVCDADQLLSCDPRPLTLSDQYNAWAFPLYDLWDGRDTYREDGFWRAHLHPRPWLFAPHRVPDGYVPVWNQRGIHTGHAPENFPLVTGLAPPDRYYWLHLGYLDPQDRETKLTKYREQYHQMTEFEQAHAESIADPHPTLRILPQAKPITVLIAAPVRKNATTLKAHLDSLAAQVLPPRVEVTYCFVDDYPSPDPAQQLLRDFVAQHGGEVLTSPNPSPSGDFDDQHPVTHQWTVSAMNRVGAIKNGLLGKCIEGGYDYLWLVDSDLLLDPWTLQSLMSHDRAIVAAVYWTRWNTDPKIHAGPQVWLKPIYQLALPHYPEHEFRHKLGVQRHVEKVGGLGACTLIARSVIEKGVHFGKPPGFPSGGLWDGEDRHFCEWAKRLHIDLWADGWPDIFHVYHPVDVERIPAMQAKLSQTHPSFANHGHLVSLRLTNVEDAVGPIPVRCRMGDGTLLPELEQAIQGMQRGEDKMVRLHFPSTMPDMPSLGSLRGQNRIILVELLDCKPMGLPPVLEDEFFVVDGIGTVQDKTHLTPDQHAKIEADA